MIIKKKYTNIKNNEDIQKIKTDAEQIIDEIPVNIEPEVKVKTEVEIPKKKNNDDFDLTIDSIKFDQREERREGTRRRGYRRTQDRNIVSRAQQDALSIKEAAKKEGYEEGLKKAKSDLEDLKNKLNEFFTYKEEVFTKVSGCIGDISIEIAKKILNKQIEEDSSALIAMIKNVVEEINKTEDKIILKVRPKDAEIVKEKLPEIFEGGNFEAQISVIPDKSIKDGGVIVETTNGIVDASIETQLAIMEKALGVREEK